MSPDALITHCVITGNTTSMSGLRGYWCGPVVQISGGGVLAHSLVAQNKGTGTPNDNLDFGFGGVSLYGSSKAIHCTIADNEGDKCAGVWSDTAGTVVDSVITGGKVREGFNPVYGNASATIFDNCFSDTEVLNTKGLSGDPGYFNAAVGKYRPRSASPLVDQCGGSCALPKVDLRGKPRVFGKTADLGCYECQNFGFSVIVK